MSDQCWQFYTDPKTAEDSIRRQVSKKTRDQTKSRLKLTLVSSPLLILYLATFPCHLPYRSPELKAFVFLSNTEHYAQIHCRLKNGTNRFILSQRSTRAHALAHIWDNKDVETHTLLLESLREGSLGSLNNPPSLFYWSQRCLCILSFTPAVFHSAPPLLKFLQ